MCWDIDQGENQIIKTTKWHTTDTNWQLINMKNSPLLNFSRACLSKHRCACFLRSVRKIGFQWLVDCVALSLDSSTMGGSSIQVPSPNTADHTLTYCLWKPERSNLTPKQPSNCNTCCMFLTPQMNVALWKLWISFITSVQSIHTSCPSPLQHASVFYLTSAAQMPKKMKQLCFVWLLHIELGHSCNVVLNISSIIIPSKRIDTELRYFIAVWTI